MGRAPVFRLIDPRKPFAERRRKYARGGGPRITMIGFDAHVYEPPKPEISPDDLVSGAQLSRRLMALQSALETLPRQARRLARLQQRPIRPGAPPRLAPMRPGHPPGYRSRGLHEIDMVLADCHALARWVLRPPDTS